MIDNDLFLSPFGGIDKLSLPKILNIDDRRDDDNEIEVINQSPYFDDEHLIKCQQNNHNSFLIFSLNCQSLNAKFDEIKIQIETFRNGGCEISAFCLQETWLGEDYDTSLLQIEGYTLISQGKICSSHAGRAIYLNNKYKYKTVEVFEKSNIWESQFLEITYQTMTKTIILGNVYRPPKDINENYQTFIDEFANKLVYLNNNRNEVIIAGDYNIDLLKINDKPIISEYFDTITSHGFFPKITLPTRLSDHHGTLIDNFLCKLCKGFFKSTSGILISNISDHFPYFISLENTQPVNTVPKFIHIKKHNPESMMKFKTELMKLDIYNNLNKDVFADPNENYNLLEEIITDTMNKSIPTVIKKLNKHKHKKTPWITQGIIKSIKCRDKLYFKMKQTPVNTQQYITLKINLKTYNGILRRSIRVAKTMYYHITFEKCKHDIKETWSTIKQIIQKTTTGGKLPDYFKIDGNIVNDKHVIANKFNTFFTNIGPTLASQINVEGIQSYAGYLKHPCCNTFSFKPIDVSTTINIIDNLNSKYSFGKDGMSNNLLKLIKNEICESVTIIINQSLTTGIFPNKLKIAKVIPLFKKGDIYTFDNYRPISLLPSISKIFERTMYDQIYNYFQNNELFYNSQYGFRKKSFNRTCNFGNNR